MARVKNTLPPHIIRPKRPPHPNAYVALPPGYQGPLLASSIPSDLPVVAAESSSTSTSNPTPGHVRQASTSSSQSSGRRQRKLTKRAEESKLQQEEWNLKHKRCTPTIQKAQQISQPTVLDAAPPSQDTIKPIVLHLAPQVQDMMMTSDERNAPEYRSSLGLHHTPSTSPQTTAGSTEIPKNDNSPTNSRKRVADVLDAAQALDYEDPNSDSSIRERQASDDFKHAMAKRSGRVSRPLKYRRLTERPGLIDERRPIHLDENLTEEQKKLEFGALLQLKLNNLANFFDMAPDAQLLMMNPQQQQEILARVKARFVQGKNSSPKEDWMHLSYDMRRHIIANASRKGPRPKKAAKKTKS